VRLRDLAQPPQHHRILEKRVRVAQHVQPRLALAVDVRKCGAQVLGAGALRGLKDTRVPMVFAAIGYWGVGLPVGVALAFPLGVGAAGLWIGLAAGLAVVAVLMGVRWKSRVVLGLVTSAVNGPGGPR
jgi:Na+-driven multidrug efflux pump